MNSMTSTIDEYQHYVTKKIQPTNQNSSDNAMKKFLKFSEKISAEYKRDANRKISTACKVAIILMEIIMILNYLHVFSLSSVVYPVMIGSIIIMLIPTVLYDVLKKDSAGIHYFIATLIVLMSGIMYSFLSYHVIIMLIFPIVMAMLYCDRKLITYTAAIGIPVMLLSHIFSAALKVVPDEPLVTIKEVLIYGFIPRAIEYFIVSLLCIFTVRKLERTIKDLEYKNSELYQEQQSIVTALSTMVESESKETGSHVKRVSEYTAILCRALEMPETEVWKVSLAAMMHDVGKILVPHDVLEKHGKLTDEEYEMIKKHTVYGKRMLENAEGEVMELSAVIAYQHHERYDGKGYAGLAGEDISIYSRCVSIADVFDALVSWRPYKKPWTLEEARKEIVAQGGKQFDPMLVKLFDEHFDEFVEVFNRYPNSVTQIDTEEILK